METKLIMPYEEMVGRLFKKDTLQMQYMHAGVGVVGEIIEYQQAVRLGDRDNKLEELGDLAFYLQAALNFHGLRLETYADAPKELDWYFLTEAGELMDTAKRFCIYGKALEEDRWGRHLTACCACFFSLLRVEGFTLPEIQIANQNKLLTGEKARYALGYYTDAQANARADKGA